MNSISKWIWANSDVGCVDTYGEFYKEFSYESGKAQLLISADSNYTVYINGKFVDSDQYPDFPYYKVYDKVDITRFCKTGKNVLAVIVWHYGKANMSYYLGDAALRYELYTDNKLSVYSDKDTYSRISHTYKNGYSKEITGQLGFSYFYDSTAHDCWETALQPDFDKSFELDKSQEVFVRPVKKLCVGDRIKEKLVFNENDTKYLYDIGFEEVGYLTLKVKSDTVQTLTVSYGEHIVDGTVRRLIGSRDFSFEIVAGCGITEYTNYFRRLGLRYIELTAQSPVEIEYISVLPSYYPLNALTADFNNDLRNAVYKTSIRTLELCMHDHYEDCPWREQGLYTMDSRNQMLCGYYAFKEYDFPRANLYLMSKDDREDGLLSICTPSGYDLTIPSFSLHYFIQVYEYTKYSGDLTLAREIMPKLKSIMKVFLDRIDGGIIPSFPGANHWNFYEWAEDLDGKNRNIGEGVFEAALNCLTSLALQYFQKICDQTGVSADYGELAKELNEKIYSNFFDDDAGLFVNSKTSSQYSELVNSWAILCGACDKDTALKIADIMTSENSLTKATLSMVGFKYDALIAVDTEKYRDYILSDIDGKYKMMLDSGATTFWETEKGDKDFHNAGSLCHGWSAMPVYYYNKLLNESL